MKDPRFIVRRGDPKIIISFISSLSLLASGMSLGYPAVSLQQLEDGPEKLSKEQASLYASILSIATLVGCLLCGPLLDNIGRRLSLVIINLPFVIGWLMLYVAPDPAPYWLLILGRVLTGLGCGMVAIPATVYIGEMSSDRMRAMLVTWPSIAMSVGILFIYLLGLAIPDNWRLVAGLSVIFPFLTTVLVLVYIKETPKWLLSRGRQHHAERSYRWIYGVDKNSPMPPSMLAEWEQMLETSKLKSASYSDRTGAPSDSGENQESQKLGFIDTLKLLGSADAWKPLLIHNLFFFFMQFAGIQVVAAYADAIMKDAGITLSAQLAPVLLGAAQLLSAIAASFVLNRCGRRPLSLISGVGLSISMIGIGMYLQLKSDDNSLSWLPLILILGFIMFAAIGFNLIPWALLGELYPTRVAGICGGITTCLANLFGFLAIYSYGSMKDALGDSMFYTYGAVGGVGTAFVYFFLPETFKKSLEEVLISGVSSATLFAAGMNLGYSAVAMPHMQDPEGPDKLSISEASWFASIGMIATLGGCLTCGPLLDHLGRKKTLLVVNIPFIVGWLILGLAPPPASRTLLYIGRLLNGLGTGMISIPANIYIAEMTSTTRRCMLVTWPSLAFSVGVLLIYALGWLVTEWRHIALISATVPIAVMILNALVIKESPSWLLASGNTEQAERSFRWIKNIKLEDEFTKDELDEFEGMKRKRKVSTDASDTGIPLRPASENQLRYGGVQEHESQPNNDSLLSFFKRPDVWKPLLILNTYFLFMQFSGVPVVTAYAVNVIISAGVKLEPYFATVMIGVVRLSSELIGGYVQNKYGRRQLSLISGVGMAACMIGLGLFHHYAGHNEDLSWLPLLLILSYVVSTSAGFSLIPWAMLGEVYPTRVAGLACGITTCLANLFGFASIKLYPTFALILGGSIDSSNDVRASEGVFFLYGGITLVSVVYLFLYLPETFQKTLQEVSHGFYKNKCCKREH